LKALASVKQGKAMSHGMFSGGCSMRGMRLDEEKMKSDEEEMGLDEV